VSLELDGMLSRFERALLERHLRSCAPCRRFSADVRHQAARLRAAPLVPAPTFALADVMPPSPRARRRRAAGFAGAVLAAATAALVTTLTPNVQQHETTAAITSNTSQLAVVAEPPSVSVPFDVGRLRLVPPASADGPVRGYYGVPA